MKFFAHLLNFVLTLLKYTALLLAAFLILLSILLFKNYKDLKSAALNAWYGRTAVTEAVNAVSARDWTVAAERAESARLNFAAGLKDLEKTRINPIIRNLSFVGSQVNDLEYLLKTGEILSASLTHVAPLAAELDKMLSVSGNFHDLPTADKIQVLNLIYQAEPELNGVKANLDLATLNLGKIKRFSLLGPFYTQINDIKNQLKAASDLLARVSPVIKLLPALSGYPTDSRFLLILQNNDELRPSGGFIGVYGLLTMKNGEISALSTDDSYHLDMPAALSDKWNLEPPAELKKYLKVKKWYLRDANWSPDWPTSARQIEQIYQGENMAVATATAPFTAIAAITPDLVSDLIALTGPLTVAGVTYNAENLQPLLQYNVEVAYKEDNIADWDRKTVINDLVAELRLKLSGLSPASWPALLKIVGDNIDAKNIQIYFPDAGRQGLVRALGAAGEVRQPEGDYLLVVDANLGAFKSDVAVKKNIDYLVKKTDGKLQASLSLNYRHEGSFDWRTTRYRSYTRVYAPLGSKLLSLEGLDEATRDLQVSDDLALQKTVFGFFLTVEPGAGKKVTVNYLLPDNLLRPGTPYQLLAQRQAGNRIENFTFRWQDDKGKIQIWSSDLETDKNFQVTQ